MQAIIQHYNKKLLKHFPIMVSKRFFPILFAFLLFFSSCLSRAPEAVNELCIINSTRDTIFFTTKYRSSNKDYIMLQPYEHFSLGGTYAMTITEIIQKSYQDLDIQIEVYKLACATCENTEITYGQDPYYIYYLEPNPLVTWAPPLVSLPDSINSFYNINSWVIVKGGLKRKWDIATFTIKKEDFNDYK